MFNSMGMWINPFMHTKKLFLNLVGRADGCPSAGGLVVEGRNSR